MASISGLSVRVSATTAKFTAGMNRVQDTASEAALSLRRLSFASESAESNLDEVGRSAVGASGGMLAFGASTEGAGFSVRGLSGSIILSLVPALATLTAALAPVVAALGGFVAVAGAIGGIGVVSIIGAIATQTEQLQAALGVVTEEIAQEFGPAFELVADVLTGLLFELSLVISELVPADTVISRLAGNLAVLGSAIIDMLPAFVELATALTTEFLPPFVTWVQDVLPNTPGLIESLVGHFREFLPMLMGMGRALGNLLPPLTEFGWTALRVIAPALGRMNSFIIDTLDFINGLSNNFSQLVAEGSLVLPFLLGLVSILGGPVTLALGAVVAAVMGFAKVFKNNFANIRDYLTGLWNEFSRVFDALMVAFNAFVSGMDFEQITAALGTFESALGDQLMQTLVELGPVFDKFIAMLRENKEEFRIIGGLVADILSGMLRLGAAIVNVMYPAIRTVLIPALSLMIDLLDTAITAIADTIRAGQALNEGNFMEAGEIISGMPGVEEAATAATSAALGPAGQGVQTVQREVVEQIATITVEDGEIVAKMDERVNQNERNAARRNRRESGTPTR